MMRKIALLISLFSNLLLSQESFEATYGLKFNFEEDRNKKENPIYERYKEKALRNSKNIKFLLVGNKTKSKFTIEDNLRNKDKDIKITLSLAGYQNQALFCNLLSNKIIRNNSENLRALKKEEFLVKKPLYNDWELTKDTRIIKGFKCYKALGLLTNNNENKKTKSVTAWYCPSISFSHGPLGFGGLPGLIFYLEIDEVVYLIQKIQIKNKSLEIDFPTKGKEITEENYNEILKKRYDKFRAK